MGPIRRSDPRSLGLVKRIFNPGTASTGHRDEKGPLAWDHVLPC